MDHSRSFLLLQVPVGDVLGMGQNVRIVAFHVVIEHVVVLPRAQAAILGDQLQRARIAVMGHDPQQIVAECRVQLAAG